MSAFPVRHLTPDPLAGADERELGAIGQALREGLPDGESTLRGLAPRIMKLLGATKFCALGSRQLGMGRAGNLSCWSGFREDPAALVKGTIPAEPPARPALPPGWQNRALQPLAGGAPPTEMLILVPAMKRLGIEGYDVLRVLLCDGASLLAWVGAARREAFTSREQLLLQRLVPALGEHLLSLSRLADTEVLRAGLRAALDAIPEPAFVVRENGLVLLANARGRERLESDGISGRLAAAVESPEHDGFDVSAIQAAHSRSFLVVERSSPSEGERRINNAASRWQLTRAELRVFQKLAHGASNKVIARDLDCSVRTVELHVSSILKKAGARSRTALIVELWGRGQ